MKKHSSKILWAAATLALVLLFLVVRAIRLWRLPYESVNIAPEDQYERIEIPPRPGIRGLVITGPRILPLYFAVDLAKAGIQPLDWDILKNRCPGADVRIRCQVDEKGNLRFNQEDVRMEGFTEAGTLIQNALRTWAYRPVKSGTIAFWFNVPSMGKKLKIDMTGMERAASIPEHVPIIDGQLHYILGLSAQDIEVGSGF
ncbi:hypothetical protein JW906_16280 [bacterium]|nr:hypothetical protein [bacterium]